MPARFAQIAVVVAAVAAGACGADTPTMSTHEVGGCDGQLTVVASEQGIHVPVGSPIEWSTNPPATGMHYPVWAQWDREYTSLNRGFWVHNAEHGGIVMLYRCDAGCPDVVASLRASAKAMAADPACIAPIRNRVIVASDPLLPDGVQVAAVAWDRIYTASCFDPYIDTFARQSYNHAPEALCAEGASLGGTFIDP
jgi:uncharacterized protein DUF3105